MAASGTEQEAKKAAKKKRRKMAMERLKLGSHYAIERFGVFSAAFAVTGALIVGSTVYNSVDARRADISSQVLYTSAFESSRTRTTGDVQGVFTNDDNTRVLLMLKLSEGGTYSNDPNDYYAYVSGIKGDNIANNPEPVAQPTVGSIYMFSDTGYMGLMLHAPEGFGSQLLNVTFRADQEFSDVNVMNDEELAANGYGPSFKEADQWRVIFNPGAEGVEVLPSLNLEGQPSPRDIYADTVLAQDEVMVRQQLMSSVDKLRGLQERIGKAEEALGKKTAAVEPNKPAVSVVPPILPDYLVGDTFVGPSREEVGELMQAYINGETAQFPFAEFQESMSPRAWFMDTEFAEGMDVATNPNLAEEKLYVGDYQPSFMKFQPAHVIPGGLNFNWQNRTILDGYIDSIVPDGKDPHEFLEEILGYAQDRPEFNTGDWSLSNGKKIKDYDRMNQQTQSLVGAANVLASAYESYYAAKVEYQMAQLMSLLELEIQLNDVASDSAVASGANAPTVDEDGNAVDASRDGVGVDVMLQ